THDPSRPAGSNPPRSPGRGGDSGAPRAVARATATDQRPVSFAYDWPTFRRPPSSGNGCGAQNTPKREAPPRGSARQILGPLLREMSFEHSRRLTNLDQVAVRVAHVTPD